MAKHVAVPNRETRSIELTVKLRLIHAVDHGLSAAEPDRARREMERRLNRVREAFFTNGKHVRR